MDSLQLGGAEQGNQVRRQASQNQTSWDPVGVRRAFEPALAGVRGKARNVGNPPGLRVTNALYCVRLSKPELDSGAIICGICWSVEANFVQELLKAHAGAHSIKYRIRIQE